MRPLVEKSAASQSAKKAGQAGPGAGGFEKLSLVLRRQSQQSASSQEGGQHAHGGAEAKVETVVEEGVVKKIIVRCSCGERIEIDCQYEA